MKNLIRSLVVVATLLASGAALAEAQLGRDYSLLNPPQPTSTKKIEVLEFFFMVARIATTCIRCSAHGKRPCPRMWS